jgi:hypothetical protein
MTKTVRRVARKKKSFWCLGNLLAAYLHAERMT